MEGSPCCGVQHLDHVVLVDDDGRQQVEEEEVREEDEEDEEDRSRQPDRLVRVLQAVDDPGLAVDETVILLTLSLHPY